MGLGRGLGSLDFFSGRRLMREWETSYTTSRASDLYIYVMTMLETQCRLNRFNSKLLSLLLLQHAAARKP
jgi:hypothetical protein